LEKNKQSENSTTPGIRRAPKNPMAPGEPDWGERTGEGVGEGGGDSSSLSAEK